MPAPAASPAAPAAAPSPPEGPPEGAGHPRHRRPDVHNVASRWVMRPAPARHHPAARAPQRVAAEHDARRNTSDERVTLSMRGKSSRRHQVAAPAAPASLSASSSASRAASFSRHAFLCFVQCSPWCSTQQYTTKRQPEQCANSLTVVSVLSKRGGRSRAARAW